MGLRQFRKPGVALDVVHEAKMRVGLLRLNAVTGAKHEEALSHLKRRLVRQCERSSEAGRIGSYTRSARSLGWLLLRVGEPSSALRPLGCAYLTACLGGSSQRKERLITAELLADAYSLIGDHDSAAEMMLETFSLSRSSENLVKLLAVLGSTSPGVHQESAAKRAYEAIRPEVTTGVPAWVNGYRPILDSRFGLRSYSYAQLQRESQPIVEAPASIFVAQAEAELARLAMDQGLPAEARSHLAQTRAFKDPMLDIDLRAPWLSGPLLGLSARIHRALGQPDAAVQTAIRGFSLAAFGLLNVGDELARLSLRRLGEECFAIATSISLDRRDWDLASELIENQRVQELCPVTRMSDDTDLVPYPTWLTEDLTASMSAGGLTAGVNASLTSGGGLRNFGAIVGWRGSSIVDEAITSWNVPVPSWHQRVDGFARMEADLQSGHLAWLASLIGGEMFWTITDQFGSFHGGRIDVRNLLSSDASAVFRGETQPGQRMAGTSVAPSLDDLSAVLPDYIAAMAAGRDSSDDPIRVLAGLPAILSAAPWPTVPIGTREGRSIMLLERVEVTHLLPASARCSVLPKRPGSPKAASAGPESFGRCSLSANADTNRTVCLDGREVPTAAVARRIGSMVADAAGGVLYLRASTTRALSTGVAMEHGLAFVDGVLSAGELSRVLLGGPVTEGDGVRVLIVIQPAGTAGAPSLASQIAVSCRFSGTDEVVIIFADSAAEEAQAALEREVLTVLHRPEAAAKSVRALQLELLGGSPGSRKPRKVAGLHGASVVVFR